ncbi:hypothetical protein [Microbulbifer halophilus]|uniref:Decarboxylase n=1 Tax=Microbulbifer halophilus TaxID=453963 RepID=A0ABW5E7P0_9GAMM|nr:hypothetical protein [Microbulbifer halophilus]MCW8126076.1 hypothetical protein [Microbulbifer halophilus]
MNVAIGVIVVTRSQAFFEAAAGVINDVCRGPLQPVDIDADIKHGTRIPVHSHVYENIKRKSVTFLKQRKDRTPIKIIQSDNLEKITKKVTTHTSSGETGGFQAGMVLIDYADPALDNVTAEEVDHRLAFFYSQLKELKVPVFCSPSSTAVFRRRLDHKMRYQPMEYIECVLPTERTVLQAELLCLWMDFFEMSYTNRQVKPQIKPPPGNTMGTFLAQFFTSRSGSEWLGFYFTGSLVSNLIVHLERKAKQVGALMLRAPNEHGLACGALANWQLYKKPFIIIVTSGMIDEFKGTIANMREARAKGIIVCAENRSGQWFAFQGTVTREEDTRDVLKARRIPHVYMADPARMADDLRRVAELYDAGEGPVVVLATQQVLHASTPVDIELPQVVEGAKPALDDKTQASLDQVMEIINEGPDRVVWQCGAMTEEEHRLVLSIARRSGVALVDSLTHPGAVAKYHEGVVNRNYLGTLAVYGYSARVYNYLHTNDKINGTDDQCLFFLKSKLAEVATPFPEGRLQRKINIVQLTDNPGHISPFTDVPIVLALRTFLEYVDRHLAVSDELRNRRFTLIDSLRETPSDVVCRIPRIPMTPNYFFARLNSLIEQVVVQDGYDYTGIYDVGRCGISAVRNLARTRRGFSGWYGRALMGDALQATTSLAFTSPTNLLAFIGDGAKAIVPDILPSLIENAISYPGRIRDKNITIFYFLNGGHSSINTYQERVLFNRTSRQMRLVNLFEPDWEGDIGDLHVVSRTLESFDRELLDKAVRTRGQINLFSVVMAHNNEGDGMSLITAKGWQRESPTHERAPVASPDGIDHNASNPEYEGL